MGFKKGFYIPKVDDLIDTAFKKARTEAEQVKKKDLASKVIEKEKLRVRISAEYITSSLRRIYTQFPKISELNIFYKTLLSNSIKTLRVRKALSHLNSSTRTIDDLKTRYLALMSKSRQQTAGKLRNEFYGRLVSVVKRCKPSFEIIKDAMKVIATIPRLKNLPTILLIGIPNTGKSTFLREVTNANVEIKEYPFTTKRLQIGKINERFIDFQILDSPGILDRPEEKQNVIEKQTTIALKTIADSLIFIIDINQDIENQKSIFKRYKVLMKNKPYFIILNKIDLIDKNNLKEIEISIKNILPKKIKIFKLSLTNLKESELKEIKDEIYNMNKDWYTKKAKEKIKLNLGF